MASIAGVYDPEASPSTGYTPLPIGDYEMEIVESSYDANSQGTGMLLKLKAQIVGGEYDERPYYINMSLEHENAQAQEIGQRDFAALRRATGVLNPTDTEQLHFQRFGVKIGIREKTEKVNGVKRKTGELENFIKEYIFERDAAPAPRQPSNDNRQAAAAQKPAAAGAKPWKKATSQ